MRTFSAIQFRKSCSGHIVKGFARVIDTSFPSTPLPPLPPVANPDLATCAYNSTVAGNVLSNDLRANTVALVNSLPENVGVSIAGDAGGLFTINADGSWTFSTNNNFNHITKHTPVDTSISYSVAYEDFFISSTLTVTVFRANIAPIAFDDSSATDAESVVSGNVLLNDFDLDDDSLSVVRVAGLLSNVGLVVTGSNGGQFVIAADGAWTFDPAGDFAGLTGSDTATTSVTYHASDGVAEAMGTLTVTVTSGFVPALWTPAEITTALWLDAADSATITLNGSTVSQWADKSGNARHATQATASAQPTLETSRLSFDGNDYLVVADTAGMQFGTGDFAAVVVANFTNVSKGSASQNTLLSKNFTGFELYNYQRTIAGYLGGTGNGASISGLTSGAWGIFSQSRLSSAHTVRRTGTASSAATNSTSASNAGQALLVGARPGLAAAYMLIGRISEIILLPAGFTTDDLQLVEGYLAHKWDSILGVTTLVDALPSDHPYKSAPPTI